MLAPDRANSRSSESNETTAGRLGDASFGSDSYNPTPVKPEISAGASFKQALADIHWKAWTTMDLYISDDGRVLVATGKRQVAVVELLKEGRWQRIWSCLYDPSQERMFQEKQREALREARAKAAEPSTKNSFIQNHPTAHWLSEKLPRFLSRLVPKQIEVI